MWERTIVSAANPRRVRGSHIVLLKVWFAELPDEPLEPFIASPLDCEAHGRELWIRAMAGEYGPVTMIDPPELPTRTSDHGA